MCNLTFLLHFLLLSIFSHIGYFEILLHINLISISAFVMALLNISQLINHEVYKLVMLQVSYLGFEVQEAVFQFTISKYNMDILYLKEALEQQL
jgi:hypothetical protein